MEAGRELDALIAEKVMGWRSVSEHVPHFSTDIATAWQVFEHWKGDAACWRNNSLWLVELYGPSEEFSARAETAALAICHAALKAVGEEALV